MALLGERPDTDTAALEALGIDILHLFPVFGWKRPGQIFTVQLFDKRNPY
jgi:hypothetical protein